MGNGTHDLDLSGEYYVLYGLSNNPPISGALVTHRGGGPNPSITANKVNVTNDTGVQEADDFEDIKNALIRAHGISMLVAWPLLVCIAIFFASWMRQALPNGEWFKIHRALMIIALFIGASGFVLIFFSQLRSPTPGLITLGSADSITVCG